MQDMFSMENGNYFISYQVYLFSPVVISHEAMIYIYKPLEKPTP